MLEVDHTTTRILGGSFAPDPAAVERIVTYALAPRERRRRRAGALASLLFVAAAGALWLTRSRESAPVNSLINYGDVYVSQSASGTRIHNNPQSAPATFQIIVKGETQ